MSTRTFRSDRRGAGIVEYGLLTGLIAVACLVAVERGGDSVSGLFGGIAERLPGVSGSEPEAAPGGGAGVGPDGYRGSCLAILDAGESVGDGVYQIDPDGDGDPMDVYCDMTRDGGGWMLAAVGANDTQASEVLETPDAYGTPLDPAQSDDAKLADAFWASMGTVTRFDVPATGETWYVQYSGQAWTVQTYDETWNNVVPLCSYAADMSGAFSGRHYHVADCYPSGSALGFDAVGIDLSTHGLALNRTGGTAWVR